LRVSLNPIITWVVNFVNLINQKNKVVLEGDGEVYEDPLDVEG